MKKIDETIATMTTENNHLGGMTMKNNLNTANDVLPEHAAEPEDFYNEEGLLCCGVCGLGGHLVLIDRLNGRLGFLLALLLAESEQSHNSSFHVTVATLLTLALRLRES